MPVQMRVFLGGLLALCAFAGCSAGGGEDDGPRGAGDEGVFHPVAGSFEPDDTKLDECQGENRCLEQAFGNIAYNDGPKAAIKLFDAKLTTDKAIEADCHRIIHTIGSAALARYEGNVARAFAEGSASCASGYYHGILERAFVNANSRDELADIARDLCRDESIRQNGFVAYQCIHGLGHGLMIQTGYDLPLALSICDGLTTSWEQTSCTGGVFMENVSSSYGFRSKWLRDNNLVYPCNVVKERHKMYCYLLVTSRILPANGYDWKATAKICSGVGEQRWVNLCFQSYGRDASGVSRQRPREIVRLCKLAGPGQQECLYGAARDVANTYASGESAAPLCELAPAAHRSRCFEGIGTIIGALESDAAERRRQCADLMRQYVRDCEQGAGITA